MKKLILVLGLAVTTLVSCQKEEEMIPSAGVAGESAVMEKIVVPTTFRQKLLMEMYATTYCATCPDAELKQRQYAAMFPGRIFGVNIHTNDKMSNPQFGFLDNLLNINQYSSGSFNRLPFNGVSVVHKTKWTKAMVSTCLNKTASCGLKITTTKSSLSGTATVTAGFNKSMSGNYKLTVYLVEDSVSGIGPGYDQSNYYNNISGTPWYHKGNPIVGYQHPFVLRRVLTSSIGTSIPATSIKAGGSFTQTFNFSTSGYDNKQLYIVAFINKAGSTPTTHEVKNVQQVKLGSGKNWD